MAMLKLNGIPASLSRLRKLRVLNIQDNPLVENVSKILSPLPHLAMVVLGTPRRDSTAMMSHVCPCLQSSMSEDCLTRNKRFKRSVTSYTQEYIVNRQSSMSYGCCCVVPQISYCEIDTSVVKICDRNNLSIV